MNISAVTALYLAASSYGVLAVVAASLSLFGGVDPDRLQASQQPDARFTYCDRASAILGSVHSVARGYGGDDYRKYSQTVKKAFSIPASDSRLDSFLVYAWLTRGQTTESVASGFLDSCYDRVSESIQSERPPVGQAVWTTT